MRREEDSSSLSPAYEELVEVVSRAVSKLNIKWPAKKQGAHPKSKLDERFLTPNTVPPPRGLPFFPDLHKVLSRSWNKPHSSRVFSSQVHVYADIKGLKEYGYGAMAKVEPTLASYSSILGIVPEGPDVTPKGIICVSGNGSRSAMSILQAYQAVLLRHLDDSEEVGPDAVRELCRATDLSLQATKETARAIRNHAGAFPKRH